MRNFAIDNAKIFLIFLVVFGHFVASMPNSDIKIQTFNVIYSFHMPAFIIISGCFFSLKKTLIKNEVEKYLIPFIAFNLIYEVNTLIFIGEISYFTSVIAPNYLMWFLWSLFIWRSITRVLVLFKYPVFASILISIILSTVPYSGLFLEISRTASFLPFFVFGYVYRENIFSLSLSDNNSLIKFALIVALLFLWFSLPWKVDLFYGFTSLPNMGYELVEGVFFKVLAFLYSLVISVAIISLAPVKKYFFTSLGASTLNIYLFHGLITDNPYMKDFVKLLPDSVGYVWAFVLIITLSALCLFLFSRKSFEYFTSLYVHLMGKFLLKKG